VLKNTCCESRPKADEQGVHDAGCQVIDQGCCSAQVYKLIHISDGQSLILKKGEEGLAKCTAVVCLSFYINNKISTTVCINYAIKALLKVISSVTY